MSEIVSKKEIKQKAKQLFLDDKAKLKARKLELEKMSDEEKAKAKNVDKEQKAQAKKARKAEIAKLEGDAKKQAKKQDKYYKKYKRRPVKYSIWGVIILLLVLLFIKIAPTLSDISELLTLDIDTSTPEGVEARENGEKLAREITDEGVVLLKNEDELLPLQEKKLNVFGVSATEMRLSGGGSGAADTSRAINFFDALNNAGIEYNTELYDFYQAEIAKEEENKESGQETGLSSVLSSMFMPEVADEPPIEYLTDDVIASAKDYSENALIVLTSDSVEASDANPEQLSVKGNKLDLIDKVANNFENVIIVVNAGNALELGFVNEYPSIKSVLWIGTPGATGPTSLAEVIAGNVNPSGRLTDTYVYDNTSAPSTENFGDYKYTNIDRMATLEYEEGIYIGYRYYETRYKDDEEAYQNTVLYPFGYGLSYTDFKWDVVSHKVDDENVEVTVRVTNTGDVAGKDVVQLYYEPPYYEGGIEKSAIVLADYAKTGLIEPKAFEEVTLSFPIRQMASWDMENEQAYVVEEGKYNVNISRNVHDTVDSFDFRIPETIVYENAENGYEYKNQFDYANGDLTYLSRNDWEGTYPTAEDISTTASDELVADYNAYLNPEKVEGEMPITNADNGIMLEDLKGLEYDDEQWELFLDQFTYEELKTFFAHGGWKTVGIERLGVPNSVLLDGPAGINFFFKKVEAAAYPAASTLAATWNDDLVYKMGESMGTEANAYGVHGIYAPAMNIHRSAYGGRNFEYYSEDPLIAGRMGSQIIQGIQSKDVAVTMKHFIMNDQEINARSGLFLWTNEQALREIYLKPFEYATNDTEVTGVMSSFIHLGYKWNGASSELLNNVLRGEMGFDGFVSTDAVFWFMDPNLALRNGNDLMLAAMPSGIETKIDVAYKEDPVGVLEGLRTSVHHVLYTLLNETKLTE